jgi:hypothetical protein
MILLNKAFEDSYYTLLNPCIMSFLIVILLSIAAGNTEVNYVSLDTIELIILGFFATRPNSLRE